MNTNNASSTVKIVGVMDEDPFDQRTWSGSSYYFFNALKSGGNLTTAFSATADRTIDYWHKLQSFQPDRAAWRFKYHLNTNHFRAMTKAALRQINSVDRNDYNTLLQVGAWYDLTGQGKFAVSYHDGNLATRLASPFGHPAISKHAINRALEHERQLYQKLDLIFPMSQWLANSFVKDFGCDKDKVIAVGAGINLPTIRPIERNYINYNLLMVGKDFRRKGGNYLLDAFVKAKRTLPKLTLTLIGPQLENLPDGVECLGFVDKRSPEGLQQLFDAFERASLFVLPSLYEPFGIALVEAMAHRIPCIGTRNCAMPEIIVENETGYLVPVADSDAIAEKIIEAFADEKTYFAMCNKAYERYLANYTWSAVTQKITAAISARL